MKRWYLYPFALLWHLITAIRNWGYDWGIIRSKKFSTPIINVGNLSVGGSGKSPMVMYIADLVSKKHRTGVLSRGYGRLTKGYRITNYHSDFTMVGDEAMQLFERFRNRFVIGVCENRVLGAIKIIKSMDLDSLILDDAYQHRAIKAGFNILMTDYNDPYFRDFVLPAGNLRESRNGKKRADLIMVSKCPINITEEDKQSYIAKIKPNNRQKVFFSSIQYDEYVSSVKKKILAIDLSKYHILLVSGIANPKPLVEHLSKFNAQFKHLEFSDHHNFSTRDIENIEAKYQNLGEDAIIITTEKDFVRLKQYNSLKEKLFYWGININIDKKEEFNQIILNYVSKN